MFDVKYSMMFLYIGKLSIQKPKERGVPALFKLAQCHQSLPAVQFAQAPVPTRIDHVLKVLLLKSQGEGTNLAP